MKKVLFVNVTTNSEWDCADVAKIEITDQTLENIKEAVDMLNNSNAASVSYYSLFIAGTDEQCAMQEIDEPYFFEEEANDINIERSEQALDTHMMTITKHGGVMWSAYGKHTGEEFWTESVPVDFLTNEKVTLK